MWSLIMHSIGGNGDRSRPGFKLTSDRELRYPVVAGGIWARNWLHDGGDASIIAVFRRSFYIRTTTDRLFCIGGPDLGLGPLNLIICDSRNHGKGGGWSTDGIKNGDRAEARRGILRIGRTLALDGSELAGWSPETRLGPVSPARLRLGLSRMVSNAQACAPPEGLGTLIPRLAGKRRNSRALNAAGPIGAAAVAAIESLETWLSTVPSDSGAGYPPFPDRARGLIGLGPGLTPSGDDFFGGLMIGLRNFGMAQIAKTLWLGLQPDLATRTNLISIAHLEAAAAGMGHGAVHALLLALRAGETSAIDRTMMDVSAIGHSSGWDTLAGLVLAIRLALENEDARVDSGLRAAALL